MKKVLVLHGPNLDQLGRREPDIYGFQNLVDLNKSLTEQASRSHIQLMTFQSNSESQLINRIYQSVEESLDYLIVNLAALTHTSISLRDALTAAMIPFIEVHISNIYARESFRHRSYFSDIARGVISGFGTLSYSLALQAIINISTNKEFL